MFMAADISPRLAPLLAPGQFHLQAGSYEIGSVETVREIRRANLLLLEKVLGSLQAVATLVGKSHSQVSQLKGGNKHSTTGEPRKMGDRVAAHFAAALNVPAGWMDSPRTEQEVREVLGKLKGQLDAVVHGAGPSVSGSLATDLAMRLAVEFASVPDSQEKRLLFDQLLEQIQALQRASPGHARSTLLPDEDHQTQRDKAHER
jgi:hypothetical protein